MTEHEDIASNWADAVSIFVRNGMTVEGLKRVLDGTDETLSIAHAQHESTGVRNEINRRRAQIRVWTEKLDTF